jgi:hypothetical protein
MSSTLSAALLRMSLAKVVYDHTVFIYQSDLVAKTQHFPLVVGIV